MEALMDLNPAALPPRKRLKSLGSSASPPSTPTTPPPHRSSPLAGPSTRPSSETNAQTTLLKRKQPEPREKEEELFIFSNQGLPPRKAQTAPHIKPRANPSPFPSDSEPEQPRRGRPGRKPGSSKKPVKRLRKEPLYCLCRQPYDEQVFMIACDVCNDWFHGECVGMTERKAQSLKTYICPPCTKSRATGGGRRKSVVKEETEDERVNVDGDSGDEGEESPQEFQRSRKEASANMRGRRGSTTAVVTSATRRRSVVSSGISRMSHVEEESAQVATGETDSSKEDIAPRRVCANKSCHHSAKPNSKYCSTECGVHVATQFLEKQKAAAMAAAAAAAPEQMRIASPKPSPKPGDASLSSSNDDLPNFSSIKRSLENSPDISAADDTDLKQLESLERQRREVEQNLRSLAVKRGDFEQAVRFSATLFATPTSTATSVSTSGEQGSQEAPEVMDCFSCGQPIAGRNFARHIEQCYTKKEGINTTSSGAVLLSASKLEARTQDDGTVIAFCNCYDAAREAYCAHVLDSCPVHSDKKGLDEHRLCGCPTSDFKSGHCERLRSECVKHFNWENIRKMEMKLEKKRQTQLLGSLDAEIELVKTRIRRRNHTRDDEHRTIEENGASNTRQHSPASK